MNLFDGNSYDLCKLELHFTTALRGELLFYNLFTQRMFNSCHIKLLFTPQLSGYVSVQINFNNKNTKIEIIQSQTKTRPHYPVMPMQ